MRTNAMQCKYRETYNNYQYMINCDAYLDNNGTTLVPAIVASEMIKWMNHGNPSSHYAAARASRAMMDEFRAYLARVLGCAANPTTTYDILFTSGASESNALICCGVINNALRALRELHESHASRTSTVLQRIHIVASAIEHKSIMYLLRDMIERHGDVIDVTYVLPDASGHIQAREMARAIRANTILVICMLANNETGAINNIAEISRAVKRVNGHAFVHSDIVQGFGKIPINLARMGVDGASISFHKLHAPIGVGVAIIARTCTAPAICPLVFGTQNKGMRGGTENVPAIAAAFVATRLAYETMSADIAHEISLKKYLMEQLSARAPCITLLDYENQEGAHSRLAMQIVFIDSSTNGGDPNKYLPNTLMVAVAKHIGPPACNSMIRDKLEEARVIVSVGSACNSSSKEHSHVLRAMNMPSILMDGAIRISMSRYTTTRELDLFVNGFIAEAKRQLDTAYARK